jgi:hypothetical protein
MMRVHALEAIHASAGAALMTESARCGRRGLLALIAMAALVCACSGGSNPQAGQSPGSTEIDLGNSGAYLTIAFPAGDVEPGMPMSIATGDFNGDGKADLLLGLPYADAPSGQRAHAGEAYVLYGPLSGRIDLAKDRPDVSILGAVTDDNLGAGVAAGDLNGDGIDDVVVGAPNSNGLANIRTDMGETYVIFGGRSIAATIDTAQVQQNFDLIPAEGFSQLGRTFAVADVNGDGIDDLIAGAPYAGREAGTPPGGPRTTVGEAYVVYGSNDLTGQDSVARDEEDVRLSGLNAYDQFGDSVAAADVNGDGIADIIVGASGYDGPAMDRADAGGVFVFYGGASLPRQATLNDAGLAITGADGADVLGTLVTAVDTNADGKAEIIASAPTAAGPGNKRPAAGEVEVIDVAAVGGNQIDLASAPGIRRIYGSTSGELAPSSFAASVGGTPRLALGSAGHASNDRRAAGAAYVVAQPADHDIDLSVASVAQISVYGAAASDGLGGSVAFADLDGDGTPELLILAAGDPGPMGPDPSFEAKLYAVRLD